MRHNFKKIISMILTVCMLLGTMVMLIPVSASAAGTTVELKLNADNIINGYNYRFETNDETGKYAKIEDGKLKFFLKKGDIFYISNLTVKDATSSYTIEGMTCPVNDMYIQIANGVSKSSSMYGSGFGGYNWKGYTWAWSGNSVNNSSWTFNSADHDSLAVSYGGTNSHGSGKDAIWAANEVLSIKGTFDTWADLVPTTHFYEGVSSLDGVGNSDMRLRWYPYAGSCVGKSFGIIVNQTNGGEISIDKITATNMNETASYVETFDIKEPAPTINLKPNADNWINGQNYRFETSNADSYAKIEDGKLILKLKSGDLFWIPSLTVKDTSSAFTFDNMTTDTSGTRIMAVTHIKTGENMYGTGIANNGNSVWVVNRQKWNGNGIAVASYDQNYQAISNWGGTERPIDGNWQSSEMLNIRGTFASWSVVVPKIYFKEGSNTEYNMRTYPSLSTGCEGYSFGLSLVTGSATVTIDQITATNMNETASMVQTFDNAAKDVTLTPNTDNWINGQNYRFETKNADSYAKIVGGKLILNMKEGDIFWIPTLTAKDTSSAFTYENITTSSANARLSVLTHVKTGENMYGIAICNSAQWVGYRYKWNGNGIAGANYDVNYGSTSWGGTSTPNGSTHNGSWGTSEALSIRTTYETWSALVPRTYFYKNQTSLDSVTSNKSNDVNFIWYPQLSTCEGTSFGIGLASGSSTFTIDKITATNMNEATSYVETFDRVVVRDVTESQASLTLNGTIGLNFAFNAENLPDTAKVVVTKNGETIANVSVVEGENVISAPVNAKEMGDSVNFSVMVDGKLFKNLSYTVSVKDYASAILADNAYAEWHDLIRAMLNYGAAAQKVLNYKTDALVADISALDYDMSSTDAVTVTGDTSKLAGLFATLTLESDTALNLYAKAKDDAVVTATVNGVDAAMTLTDDGFYRFTVADVAAEELSDDFVVVLNGETTVTISVSRWAKTTVNANESDDMTTLAKALAAYSAAADAK